MVIWDLFGLMRQPHAMFRRFAHTQTITRETLLPMSFHQPTTTTGCSFCPEAMVMGNRAGNFIIPQEFRDAFLGVSEMLCMTIESLAQNGDLSPLGR
jgi:hypothetical protein